MEDLKVDQDLKVTNSYGKVIQFRYGDDGYNFNNIESQSLDLLSHTFEELEEKHRFESQENWELFLDENTQKELEKEKDSQEKLDSLYQEMVEMVHLLRGEIFQHSTSTAM